MQRYSLDFTDLFGEQELLINSLLTEIFPNPLGEMLEDKRKKVKEILDDLEKEILSSDPNLKTNLENTRRKSW